MYIDNSKSIDKNASLHILRRRERLNNSWENNSIVDQLCMKVAWTIEYHNIESRIAIHILDMKTCMSNTEDQCQIVVTWCDYS
jgi:hypothetical protein